MRPAHGDQLEQLSSELASTAGSIDRAALRRRLHGLLGNGSSATLEGWTRLRALNEQARASVTRALTVGGPSRFQLARLATRKSVWHYVLK